MALSLSLVLAVALTRGTSSVFEKLFHHILGQVVAEAVRGIVIGSHCDDFFFLGG